MPNDLPHPGAPKIFILRKVLHSHGINKSDIIEKHQIKSQNHFFVPPTPQSHSPKVTNASYVSFLKKKCLQLPVYILKLNTNEIVLLCTLLSLLLFKNTFRGSFHVLPHVLMIAYFYITWLYLSGPLLMDA